MREVLQELNDWTREGEDIAIATVIETWGSSPRPLGSKMLVTRSGKMAGSVSNGCIEGAVFEEAQKVLKTEKPKVAAFGVSDDVAFGVGLACGGPSEAFVQPRGKTHRPLGGMSNPRGDATRRPNLATGEAMSKVPIDSSTYVVVLTHDPKFDLPALRSVLKRTRATSARSAAARRIRTASTRCARKDSPRSSLRRSMGRSASTSVVGGLRRPRWGSSPRSRRSASAGRAGLCAPSWAERNVHRRRS